MAVGPALVAKQNLEQFRPQPSDPFREPVPHREADDNEVDSGWYRAERLGDGKPSVGQRYSELELPGSIESYRVDGRGSHRPDRYRIDEPVERMFRRP